MIEILASISALLAMVGAWFFGRARYRAGQAEGARFERRRAQEVTRAISRRLESHDARIMTEIERAQEIEAHELRRTLDLGPTPSQVQDLLAQADEEDDR